MKKSDLLPGDILLLKDEPKKDFNIKHLGIRLGQAFTGLYRENLGGSSLVHAVIWIADGADLDAEIAEASGSCKRVQVRLLQPGLYVLFRPRNQDLGRDSANLAVELATDGQIDYGKNAAVQSVFHASRFGKKGRARAALYARDDFKDTVGFNGGAFCSEFVIACYQGAAGKRGEALTGMLAADAKHCSVRALNDLLIRDTKGFKWAGNVVE
jgi:hypothetical protein